MLFLLLQILLEVLFFLNIFRLSSLCLTIAFACFLDIPATYEISENVAVFKSTPTLFTESSTTLYNLSSNLVWFTSCWYCPTPIAFGSIFTSSDNGSCNLLAIEIAPLILTFTSGNSSAPSFDAEYTDAPA